MKTLYNSSMTRIEEWDWPPRQRRWRRFRETIDVYQPTGWASPRARKAVDIYCRVMITAVKMVVAVPLSLAVVGSIWLIWILLTL